MKTDKQVEDILEEMLNHWKLAQFGIRRDDSGEAFGKSHKELSELISQARADVVKKILDSLPDNIPEGVNILTTEEAAYFKAYIEIRKLLEDNE